MIYARPQPPRFVQDVFAVFFMYSAMHNTVCVKEHLLVVIATHEGGHTEKELRNCSIHHYRALDSNVHPLVVCYPLEDATLLG